MSISAAPGAPSAHGAPEAPGAPSAPAAPAVWVERTGTRTYRGHNSRGAQVAIGPATAGAVFTPGELLKVALAGCAGMSADTAIARRLGDEVAVTVAVSGAAHPVEDRFPDLAERLVVDMSGLSQEERERLVTVVRRAIAEACTVGRTLEAGARVDLEVVDAPAATGAP